MTDDIKPAKRARKKVTTDLGRQLLTRERQRLSREQAALAEQQLLEAERRRTQQKRNTKAVNPIDMAVSRSIVRRFAAVLGTEGVNVRITCTPSHQTSAWTDFEQIVINYAPQDDPRILAATLRGLAYHEGGHCRWTLPYLDLAEAAGVEANRYDRTYHHAWNCLEDQRMESAVVADSPRKASYLTTMVMTDLVPSVNHAAANWPLLIWRRFLPSNIRSQARKLFVHKNNLQGIDGEALALALEAVTTKYVLASDPVVMWQAVVECHELLKKATPLQAPSAGHERQYTRNTRNMDDYLIVPIDMDDEDITDGGNWIDVNDEVEESTEVTTEAEFDRFQTILHHLLNGGDVICVIYTPNTSSDESEQGEGGTDSTDEKGDEGEEASKGDDEGDDEQGGDGSKGEESEAGDDDGMETANERPDGEKTTGGSTGEHKNTGVRDDLDYGDNELTDEDLQKAIEEAQAERDSDATLDADVRSLQDSLNNQTSALMPYNSGTSNDLQARAAADNLAQDIEQAFQENTLDKAPGWVEGQRRGFVNVLRYETRRPGDVEFFRNYIDTDAPGTDISVSILLDYSASMSGSTKELAQMGYASKVACDRLGIPCTVVLWDSDATVLWDANEQAESLPVIVATGGTEPSIALADLDNQRYDKGTHLVIIMTDGEWGGQSGQAGFLASYRGDSAGRYFIGLGYSDGGAWAEKPESMALNLRRYGCDESHGITNLAEVPKYLEQALIAFA